MKKPMTAEQWIKEGNCFSSDMNKIHEAYANYREKAILDRFKSELLEKKIQLIEEGVFFIKEYDIEKTHSEFLNQIQ